MTREIIQAYSQENEYDVMQAAVDMVHCRQSTQKVYEAVIKSLKFFMLLNLGGLGLIEMITNLTE